ncbi:unnamed protein product [Zymoseptoria tritici ST99CH_1E4]|uniref:Uncharacterized protein n=1 Tax=Zymoseptoria tritici ST99CH_1E4 TaxID=1276532 RepID=A0A2H1H0R3_ZYMTR|nr:unnamed protein product [Zymoseptoria tritici ST99CH_1E4]
MAFRTSSEMMRDTSANMLISGPTEAIAKLQTAFSTERLTLPTQYFDSGEKAFDLATAYQLKKGTFPTLQDIEEFEPILESAMRWPEYTGKEEEIIAEFSKIMPPIGDGGFDVNKTMMDLRLVSRAHHEDRVYEIGLITQVAGQAASHVVLISSYPGRLATDTMWMVRQVEVTSGGAQRERWGALTETAAVSQQAPAAVPSIESSPPTPSARSTLPAAPTAPTITATVASSTSGDASSSTIPTQNDAEDPDSDPDAEYEIDDEYERDYGYEEDTAGATMPQGVAPNPSAMKIALTDLMVSPDPSAGAGLTDDQLLDGRIDPDKLVGDIIFDLALRHSTPTLETRINAIYTALNLPTRGRNTYTKRVSNAFDARAEKMEPLDVNGVPIPIGILKYQFDWFRYERKLRGRKPHMADYENKGKKKGNWSAPKNPARAQKRKAARIADSGSSNNAAPPLKRGRKMRKTELGSESDDEKS